MKKNKKGFTLAEVLITLSIIGVIAAILFPSILANYNERTLKAKRQALFGRMSQAMGEMADQFRNYQETTCTNLGNPLTCADNGSALKFVNEGLSKVYKVAAVCDNDNLAACDIPEEITRTDGSVFSVEDNGMSIMNYNQQISINAETFPFDTKSVGVITKNGESLLLFYNPNCEGKSTYYNKPIYTEAKTCVNMIYDLNGGKKKPNKVGEDIGYISVFYSDAPYVATARPYYYDAIPNYRSTTDSSGNEVVLGENPISFANAKAACASLGSNVGLPSLEEGMAIQYNEELNRAHETRKAKGHFWTGTMDRPDYSWIVWINDHEIKHANRLYIYSYYIYDGITNASARCVYKD